MRAASLPVHWGPRAGVGVSECASVYVCAANLQGVVVHADVDVDFLPVSADVAEGQ